MIDGKELKNKISEADVITILGLLGATYFSGTEEEKEAIITNSVCHHSDSHKLYYYKESKKFHCYSQCGDSFDIIDLVQRSKKYDKKGMAIQWISNQLGIDDYTYGFSKKLPKNDIINDWSFINGYKNNIKPFNIIDLPEINNNIMNVFQKYYWKNWIDENITKDTMKKYNIRYSALSQKVIIPHYDINNRLVGIRGRSMDEEEAELYGKYTPFMWMGTMFNHPLSQNLYGINENKETIKKKRKVMIFEGEKSVLQVESMFPNENFTVALCGNNLSDYQRDLILSLGVEEVIIALDRQYKDKEDSMYITWSKHIRERIISKLAPYVRVFVIWDTEDKLDYKDSPSDKGKQVLLELMKTKLYVGTYNNKEVECIK